MDVRRNTENTTAVTTASEEFHFCTVTDPRSPNGEPMFDIEFQCSGDAYIQFGRKLDEFSSALPAPIGRRPLPLQDNTAVFAIGNSHIRQIFYELVCQYSGKIETFHDEFTGGFGEHFSVKFRNNATLVVMTNSLFVYSPNWLEHLESVTKRKLSSFDAIVLGKFNGYKESRGTIFAAAIQNISAGYSDVNFQITPAPKLHNLAAVYRGPLIYVGMFAKYGQQQKDESIITMKEERRKNNRANIYVIDARKNIKALGECGSDDKYTMGRCHESGDVNANRESENMHRCVGELGGHPDLIDGKLLSNCIKLYHS